MLLTLNDPGALDGGKIGTALAAVQRLPFADQPALTGPAEDPETAGSEGRFACQADQPPYPWPENRPLGVRERHVFELIPDVLLEDLPFCACDGHGERCRETSEQLAHPKVPAVAAQRDPIATPTSIADFPPTEHKF